MYRFAILLLPALATGCPGYEPCTEDEAEAWYLDADGDGWSPTTEAAQACWAPGPSYVQEVSEGLDCDDADAAINPGAEEICDELDNDCDGETDGAAATDSTTWYRDADGDGWGDSELPVQACGAEGGLVERDGDCDDEEASVNPEATELWNGADDDCDEVPDDLAVLNVASGLLEGDSEHQEAGTALVLGGDFIDGTMEAAGDDFVVIGRHDEPTPLWALDASTYGDEGSLGLVASSVLEIEDPVDLESIRGPMRDLAEDDEGLDDWLLTASLYEYHFAIVLEHGPPDLESAVLDGAFTALFGDTTFNAGLESWVLDIIVPPCGEECRHPKASAGGHPDADSPASGWVALGLDRYSDDTMGSECGAVVFFEGPFSGGWQRDNDGYGGYWAKHLVGEGSDDRLGTDLLFADFDDMTGEELLVGAGAYPGTGDELGAIYLVDSQAVLDDDGTAFLGADVPYYVRVEGATAGAQVGALGNLVTPGDLDGDGLLELVVPSPNASRVYVLFAPTSRNEATLELSDTELLYDEDLYALEALGVGFGAAVAAASDIDGDGYDDLAVGAPDAPGADGSSLTGATWVFSPARVSWSATEANGTDRASSCLYGEHAGDGFGSALAAGGDVDDDGNDDLLVGAPGWDARYDTGYLTDEGRVYLILGTEL